MEMVTGHIENVEKIGEKVIILDLSQSFFTTQEDHHFDSSPIFPHAAGIFVCLICTL
jgi:hypothetical protein